MTMQLSKLNSPALGITTVVVLVVAAVFGAGAIERQSASVGGERVEIGQALLTAMLDEETGARGFFQTGDRVFLQPFNLGTVNFRKAVSDARATYRGNSKFIDLIQQQTDAARIWRKDVIGAIRARERQKIIPNTASALRRKSEMDHFRAINAQFLSTTKDDNSSDLAQATTISAGIAAFAALLLALASVQLVRRNRRRNEARARNEGHFRDLLQSSESEDESRHILMRYLRVVLPGSKSAIFNRNNSRDRLELTTDSLGESTFTGLSQERLMHPRTCMAVRLSRDHTEQNAAESLLQCELCGGISGWKHCEPLLVSGEVIGSVLVTDDDKPNQYCEKDNP